MGFSCKQCCYSAETISVFIRHVKEHRNLANFRFSCGLVGCPCSFRTATALQIHMYRNHSKPKPAVSRSPRCIDLTCHIEGCAFTSTNFSSLCEPLKWHIRDGKKIECPFESCKKNFRVRSSFLSHMSRKHSAEQAASAGGVSGDNTDNPDDGNGNDYGTDHAEFAEIGESFSNKEDGDGFLTNLECKLRCFCQPQQSQL